MSGATVDLVTGAAAVPPEASGVDLARVALRSAREAARRRGTESGAAKRKKPARTGSRLRVDGREPVGLSDALRGLMTDRAWDTPVAGGSVLADWPTIAPEMAAHAQAVAHDPATGRLVLRPASPAWATQLRLHQAALLTRIAEHTGPGVVRAIRVLPPGALGSESHDAAPPAATAAQQPEPHEPSPGYQRAKAAHQTTQRKQEVPLPVREAIARQDAILASNREPENQFAEAIYQQDRLQTQQQRAQDSHQQALRRARADRAARAAQALPTIPPTDTSRQRLDRTA